MYGHIQPIFGLVFNLLRSRTNQIRAGMPLAKPSRNWGPGTRRRAVADRPGDEFDPSQTASAWRLRTLSISDARSR